MVSTRGITSLSLLINETQFDLETHRIQLSGTNGDDRHQKVTLGVKKGDDRYQKVTQVTTAKAQGGSPTTETAKVKI